jgi:hypothetical protein
MVEEEKKTPLAKLAEQATYTPPPEPGQVDMKLADIWLRQRVHAGDLHCPLEQPGKPHGPYIIAKDLIALTKFIPGGGIALGPTTYPAFMLICQTCGYSMLFNWGVILQSTKGKPNVE